MPKKLADQLRQAIDASGLSRYAICKLTGISESRMSRFMNRKAGLSVESVETICRAIDAELTIGKPRKRK
jgi:transcriptional regulator with XRE-family HTH domain